MDCCKEVFTKTKQNWKHKQRIGNEQVDYKKTMTNNRTTQTQRNNVGNENNIEIINPSSLQANIQFSQPLTHVSITKNSIETNIHLQTSRSLNRVKQDMLLVPKTISCTTLLCFEWKNESEKSCG